MLIGFKFGNFRSFKKIQEFSLIPGQVRTHNNHFIKINDKLNVLPFSCIYGPNASGKSTIILALDVVRGLLIHGGDSMVNNLYYRGDEEIKSSSYFEYELSINGKQYSYGFEFNFSSLSIESEWLIDFTNKERKIFERDVANGNFICGLKDKNETNRLRLYLEDNSKNNKRLFLGTFIKNLSYANISSVILEEMLSVYNELIFNMIIIKPSIQQIWNIDFEKNKDKILYYLQKADINIKDIIYERTSIEYLKNILSISAYEEIMDQYRLVSTKYANTKLTIRYANEIAIIDKDENGIYLKNLRFVHNNSNSTFGAYEESTGTLRILELLSILLTNDKIYIIDEFDTSLHPILMKEIIEDFLNENMNNQLIITTHETILLDFELLRRDEIWFTEKLDNGESKLYSLEEFKDIARFDLKIEKGYLEGRFGAIPNGVFVNAT